MTQEEKWRKNYKEVAEYMDTYHRNPSKHRVEDHLMLNWMKHQRKLLNRGELKTERKDKFQLLLAKADMLKRDNQWEDTGERIEIEDALRDYQQVVLHELRKVGKTRQSVMVQMPTGTGKTHLMAAVIREYAKKGVLVVAHRRELIEQIKVTVTAFGIDLTKDSVIVESIQKLSRQKSDDGKRLEDVFFSPSLVIIDEAHHALASTYKMLWEWWPDARFLGLTATPCRLSGEPFTDLFDILLQSWDINKFIKEGWLSDLDYISVRSNSITMSMVASLTKRGTDGDFQTKQMATVLDTPESIEHLYRSYKQYADGKKGIVYAINVEHARHIANYYQTMGLRCAVIDSKTPAGERQQTVEDYRLQGLDILVNVDIFSEGFDVPAVEFIQLARPTLSLSKYYQQIGRGMRTSEGKEKVIILDQVGLYLIFGLPTIERDWQAMFRGEIRGKGNLKNLQNPRQEWWESIDGRILVNEEMVRVSDLQTERRNGRKVEWRYAVPKEAREIYGKIEIFKDRGHYGIKVAGVVTCPPEFEAIEKMSRLGKKYFGLATLPTGKTGSEVTRTVITKDGEDMHARLTGRLLEVDDDVFAYRLADRGRFVPMAWDARYDRYYSGTQHVKLGGIQFFVDDQGTYILRSAYEFQNAFKAKDVLYNDRITIIGNDLFVKDSEVMHYTIVGFKRNRIIAEDAGNLIEIADDGWKVKGLAKLPKGMTSIPLLRDFGLQREYLKGRGESGLLNLRDYQDEMLEDMERAFKRNRCVVLQTPMGAGKSVVVKRLIRQGLSRAHSSYRTDRSILFVAHRPEVMAQIARCFEQSNLSCAIIPQNYSGPYGYDTITIVNPQTIDVFIRKVNRYYSPAMVVVDEVHTVGRDLCERLKKEFSISRMLGLSATPCTEDGKPLSKTFGRFVQSWCVSRLIKGGWLRDLEVVKCKEGADDIEGLYSAYKKNLDGKKGVVFASDEQHASRIAECYRMHGVKSGVIGFSLSTEERERLTNEFEAGVVNVLVCVNFFSDGMRCPDIDFVQLANATDSLNTYLHQVGCAMHPGKDDEYGEDGITIECRKLMVLDHGGLTKKFGLPTDERDWSAMFVEKDKKKTERKGGKRSKKKDNMKDDMKGNTPVMQSPSLTKWQQRMMRLLGDMPSGQASSVKT